MGRSARSQRGFTLLEVLVALAVTGIALVVLLQAVSGTLRLERAAHDYTRALALAQARLDAVSLEEAPASGVGEADGFRWWVQVTPAWWDERSLLYRVAVTIERPTGPPVSLETFRLGERRE